MFASDITSVEYIWTTESLVTQRNTAVYLIELCESRVQIINTYDNFFKGRPYRALYIKLINFLPKGHPDGINL